MKLIPLTQGQFAIIDDDNFERINAHKWFAKLDRCTNSYYAARNSPRGVDGKQRTIRMHREILNASKGVPVDHINHDTLDNRRENLRECSSVQNQANRRLSVNNTSGFKGVNWDRRSSKMRAAIRVNGKTKHIGYYVTAQEAAIAYDNSAIRHHGEFALTNWKLGLTP